MNSPKTVPAEQGIDLREKGAVKNGERQAVDRRLFVQFLAYGGCQDAGALGRALEAAGVEGAVYADAHDPRGVGLLTLSEDPGFFVQGLRSLLLKPPFAALEFKPRYSMLGRTYALGHEPDVEDWVLRRPRRTALNPRWPWAVWYPLRRASAFAALPSEEQVPILREHGKIGHAFGDADLAHDVRLACHGLDPNDNDFVIGLMGRDLHPLSACVQVMRKTRQTSQYMQSMGPFFVGRAVWQAPLRV